MTPEHAPSSGPHGASGQGTSRLNPAALGVADAARVLSTSKEAAARAKELADKAIETELPSDALPGQRAERKGELLQGPSMVREGRKDRPEWCADCLPTARAAAALTRDHFSHAIASHKGGPYSYQQQNRVHLIRAL